jgi:hypothetical protein
MNITSVLGCHQGESPRISQPGRVVKGCPPPSGIEEQNDDLGVPATVHLNGIIDALEMQFDESLSYLDLDSGQVVTVSEALLREAEEATRRRIFLTGRKTKGDAEQMKSTRPLKRLTSAPQQPAGAAISPLPGASIRLQIPRPDDTLQRTPDFT